MNLLEIREQFAKMTGRYDLVNPSTYADNGVDVYINAGQKWLDGRFRFPKDVASYFPVLTASQWFVPIPMSRAIQRVWALTTAARTKLAKIDPVAAREYYSTPPSGMDTDVPKYYWPTHVRQVPDALRPEHATTTAATTAAPSTDPPEAVWESMIEDSTYHSYNGLVIMPPPPLGYTLEVVGLFYTPELKRDASTTYWSSEFPLVLIMAAARQLEVVHRNTTGVKDWEAAIQSELVALDMDGVEQDIAEADQMED